MKIFSFPTKSKKIVLALGAESAGNFSVYSDGKIYFSEDFGDLLEEENFSRFKKAILAFLKKESFTPNVILTDLHPLLKTTLWGETLAKKYKAQHIQVQHHHAHVFSAVGDAFIQNSIRQLADKIQNSFYGIAMDGTGYGEDGKIWGGEVFQVKSQQLKVNAGSSVPLEPHSSGETKSQNKTKYIASNLALLETKSSGGTPELAFEIKRIGHLENQILLGGEMAIREPARMLISILSKFLTKKEVFNFVKKYYSKNEFEVLYNQLEKNFNCLETSSTGRILDAVSLLLGFCGNERNYKHEPIDLLEKNSTKPYLLKPIIENNILQTTPLFEYLIINLHKDKKRLAATAQRYLAEGLWEIVQKNMQSAGSSVPLEPHSSGETKSQNKTKYIASNLALPETKSSGGTPELAISQNQIFSAGGLTNNRIISDYFVAKNIYLNKKIPRGDAGLSFGQITWFLLS